MVLGDAAQPLDPHLGLARQAIAVAFGFDQRRAQLGDAGAQHAGGRAVGLGVGDRRQPRLAEGAAHLGLGDVAHDLGHRLLGAGKPRAQLVGAARHLGMPVARLRGGALGLAMALLRGALGRAGRLARFLRSCAAPPRRPALVRARLLDAESSRPRAPRPASASCRRPCACASACSATTPSICWRISASRLRWLRRTAAVDGAPARIM